MAFEEVERLGAVAAAPERLAGRGAEAADLLGVRGTALRAFDRAARRRSDAVGAELLAAFGADPVGRPGGREDCLDPDVTVAGGVERGADVPPDHLRGRTAGISRGDDDSV